MNCLLHAQALVESGLSIVPIRLDGTKAAAVGWDVLKKRLPTSDELNEWFGNGRRLGLAAVGGRVSGNLEVVDCDLDAEDIAPRWEEMVEAQAPGLIKRLGKVRTPRPGFQYWYRCETEVAGNTKLALRQVGVKGDGAPDVKSLIETRGEGGYAVAVGSPLEVHPTRRRYELLGGDLLHLSVITASEREILLSCARALNEYLDPERHVRQPAAARPSGGTGEGLRPGDDYNRRADVLALLQRHGWTVERQGGDYDLLRRPGKDGPAGRGWSASLGKVAPGVLHVFSSNAHPFEMEGNYDPFAVYALLEQRGDFRAAAKALYADGYGDRMTPEVAPMPEEKDAPPDGPPETDVSRNGSVGIVHCVNVNRAPQNQWEAPIPFQEVALPAFPSHVLPRWLRAFVEAEAEATQTPVDLPGLMSLAVLSTTLAKKFRVRVAPGYEEPVNVWVLPAQPSGTRKSQVVRDTTAPLEDHEERETEQMAPLLAKAASELKIAETALSHVQGKAAKAGTEMERHNLTVEAANLAEELAELQRKMPHKPKLLAGDVTPEKMSMLLAEQGGRMAVLSPEGGGIFEIMNGRYSNNGAGNFEVYLNGHSGDTIRVERVGRGDEYVRDPAITMGLAVQPDVIRGLTDKPGFRGRGLLARYIYSVSLSLLGRRKPCPDPVSEDVREAYRRQITALLNLPFNQDEEGKPCAWIVTLSPEALDLHVQLRAWIEPQLAAFGALSAITDWAGKLAGNVVRAAGLLHVATHAEDLDACLTPIPAGTMAAAILYGHWAIPHAKAAFAAMGANPMVDHAKRILVWIKRNGEPSFTKRDCFRALQGTFHQVEEMEPALRLLVDHGYIRRQMEDGDRGPGRPSEIYDVNPAENIDKMDTTRRFVPAGAYFR